MNTKLISLVALCFTKIRNALRYNPWGIPVPAMVTALVVGAVVVVKFLPVVLLLGVVGAFVAAVWGMKEAGCR